LVYLFIVGIFTVAAGAWYTLAFVVCPFGYPVAGPQRAEGRYPPHP
jgi:hypothetical protein